jgi:hypothetical protein
MLPNALLVNHGPYDVNKPNLKRMAGFVFEGDVA